MNDWDEVFKSFWKDFQTAEAKHEKLRRRNKRLLYVGLALVVIWAMGNIILLVAK
jgi:hypothetical protein